MIGRTKTVNKYIQFFLMKFIKAKNKILKKNVSSYMHKKFGIIQEQFEKINYNPIMIFIYSNRWKDILKSEVSGVIFIIVS